MRRRRLGFTLIELLVAVVVFALAMGLAFAGLNGLLGARRQIDAQGQALRQLQLAVSMLERDVRQTWLRPARDAFGAPLPALQLRSGRLELTRGGYGAGLAPRRSQLERVAWTLEDKSLRRATWSVLDRAPASRANSRELLPAVESLEIELLNRERRWSAEWPPLRGSGGLLPLAVRIRIQGEAFGRIERLLELPEAESP